MLRSHLRAALSLAFVPALLVPVLLLGGCGYQGDPERIAEENAKEFREATAELKAVAEKLGELTDELSRSADELEQRATQQAARDMQRAAAAIESLAARIGSGSVTIEPGTVVAPTPPSATMPSLGTPPIASAETVTETAAETAERATYELPMVRYEWDPSIGDASVSAELGGPGFTGDGWETNMEFPALGDAAALKGGDMTLVLSDWPATLRQHGKDWNQSFNYWVNDLCMQRLIAPHPVTLEYMPQLATHWWISEDKMTYRFRLNPKARWGDGAEITADDVVASWKLRMDPDTLDPSSILTYGKLNEPVSLSKYMLEVTCNEENWRNLLYFGGMSIMPAASISIPGAEYLDRFQFDYPPFAGPYEVRTEDIVTGEKISIRRRADWWDADNPAWKGIYNLGRLDFVIVLDQSLTFEKVKKGEIDFWTIPKAEWYAKLMPEEDSVKRGLLVRHKVFNDAPVGTSGIAINMDEPGLDDVRVRKALQLLHPREQLIEELYYDEYTPLTSYWQGGLYQNPKNELFSFDPDAANLLLDEAGWTESDRDGYRMQGGRRLEFTVNYRSALSERGLTVYQERCQDAGIKLNLALLTPAAGWKNLREKKYQLFSTAWGALIFPNPETSWKSELADQLNTNNVTAFRDPRVDELCEEYDQSYDVNRRVEIVREIDGLIYPQHPYVLEHYGPAQRSVYWNKYRQPASGGLRFADNEELIYTWWYDPELAAELDRALADPSLTMDPPPEENRWWQRWNELQRAGD